MSIGRPTKLNDAVKARICEALEKGNTRRVACLVGGISEQTFSNWMNRGGNPKLKKDGNPYASERPFIVFFGAIKKAEAKAEEEALQHIKDAMPDTWQAAAWYLERKNPANWAKQERNAARQEGEDKVKELLSRINSMEDASVYRPPE